MKVSWRSIIEEINSTAPAYLLCVSGGVDSMFMLDFFHRKCTKPFRVAHFNHGLRSIANAEEAMVRDYCENHAIEFQTQKGDPDAMRLSSSLEAAARDQRYAFFESIRKDDEFLVTGHHANDQVETVLMRLMRGYPDDNLRMLKVDEIRYKPFLSVTKEEILSQAIHREIPWMEDESNADEVHERNWLRNSLIPQMMERRNVLRTIGLKEPASLSLIAYDDECVAMRP